MRLVPAFVLALVASWIASGQSYTISTLAGPGVPVNVQGLSASLYGLEFVAADRTGNLYFSDNNAVLRLDAVTGLVTPVAGSGIQGVAVDSAGNVYISNGNNWIQKISSSGVVTVVAGSVVAGFSGDGGPATSAQLLLPSGIALDAEGNLYINDLGNQRVRKVSNGVITTVAGNGTVGFSGDNGPAINAAVNTPAGIVVDSGGNLYIADSGNSRIRKVANGVITTVAGSGSYGFSGDGGPATSAQLYNPFGVAVDAAGNLYIADSNSYRIRKVSNGIITTVAGNGTNSFSGDNGPASGAGISTPLGIAVDSSGDLYFADSGFLGSGNNRLRKVSTTGVITTVAGNGAPISAGGPAASAPLNQPSGVAVDSAGNIYIADSFNNLVRKVSNGTVTTFAGDGTGGFSGDNGPATSAELNHPYGLAIDSAGSVYINDAGSGHVRKVSNGTITTVVGPPGYYSPGFSGDNGPATGAGLNGNFGIAVDREGNLYIADAFNNRIREVSNGIITTVAGSGTAGFSGDGGPATSAELNYPLGVAVDSAGDLYIADSNNFRVRKVSNGVITTLVGEIEYRTFNFNLATAFPQGLAVDSGGNLYVSLTSLGIFFNDIIVKVANNVGTVVAGNGTRGFGGDGGPATSAVLGVSSGLAVDTSGNVYIADTGNNRIRLLVPLPLSIGGPSAIPAGAVGVGYSSVAFAAIGGTGIYTWSAAGLPNGLSLSAGGMLAGTPTLAGTYNSRFTVTDSGGHSASTSLSLTVYPASSPVILSLSPSSALAAGVAFTLTVNGTGFLSGATVQWSGTALATTFIASTQLTALVPSNLIAAAGKANIMVVNPGGVNSVQAVFTVNAPGSTPQTITFWPLPDATFGVSPLTIVATASSGLAVSFTSTTPAVCTVAGTTATLVAPGPCSITATQAGSVTFGAATPVTQSFTVAAAGTVGPVITQGSIGPADSSSTTIQAGSWITLYGTNLASTTASWNGDFVTTLAGVAVTIDGKKAYLSYVSPTQINMQAPDDAVTGVVPVTITNGTGSWTSTVTLGQVGPSFLLLDTKHVAGIILKLDGSGDYGHGGESYDILGPTGTSLGYKTVAAKQGDLVVLFGVGFGPTDPPEPAGQTFSGSAATTNAVQLAIGSTTVLPSFAGLSSAGLYQINLTIPAGTGPGDQALVGTISAVQTQASVLISLQ